MYVQRQTVKYERGKGGSRKETKFHMKNALKILQNSLPKLFKQSERCRQNIKVRLQIITLDIAVGYKGCTGVRRVGEQQHSGLKRQRKTLLCKPKIRVPKMDQIAVTCPSCELPGWKGHRLCSHSCLPGVTDGPSIATAE